MEDLEKVPDWLTTRITYTLPKSGDSKEVRNYQSIMCLITMYKTLLNNSQKNFHTFGRAEHTTSRAERISPWK